MVVTYGLGSWLPQIMHRGGYDLGSSLGFLAVFSLSSAIGGVAIGRIADRFGARLTISVSFLVGALAIAALSFKSALLVNYLFVAVAGFGSVGVALVLLGYISAWYEPHARGTATGYAVISARLGAMSGPLIGGCLAALNIGAMGNFLAFAVAALCAALVVSLTPAPRHAARAAATRVPLLDELPGMRASASGEKH
jgi:AAHS family benzoate transporter-like MFS transporter